MAAIKFEPASGVESIARILIASYHKTLADIPIRYVFCPETTGKRVDGYVHHIDDIAAFLADPTASSFFVVVVAKPTWDRMNQKTRAALVDHLLSCCGVRHEIDGSTTLFECTPDIVDFSEVIRRHGLWQDAPVASASRHSILFSPWLPFHRGTVLPITVDPTAQTA